MGVERRNEKLPADHRFLNSSLRKLGRPINDARDEGQDDRDGNQDDDDPLEDLHTPADRLIRDLLVDTFESFKLTQNTRVGPDFSVLLVCV